MMSSPVRSPIIDGDRQFLLERDAASEWLTLGYLEEFHLDLTLPGPVLAFTGEGDTTPVRLGRDIKGFIDIILEGHCGDYLRIL